MTPYLMALTLMLSSVIFFSPKTEQSRVVTIQRPLVITQERKTPAFYVYQQSQNIVEKKSVNPPLNSVYLSQLSVLPETAKVQVAEMKFTKREFAAIQQGLWQGRSLASELTEDTMNLAYEKVIYTEGVESPLYEQANEVPELSPSKKWATIKGKFELVEGVGIVDHIVELKRIEEGVVREVGKIDLRAGTYSIDIESPQGMLIARIRDRQGFIVGEDSQRLVNLKSKGNFFEGPFIRVGKPNPLAWNPEIENTKSASGFGVSKTSGLSVSFFDGQKDLSTPEEELTNVSKFSSSIARAYDPGQVYKNLVTVRLTGDKSKTPTFTKKWVDGVIEYVSDMRKIEFKNRSAPVLIGKVLAGANGVAGATLEVEGHPGISAIYFDQFMIPSRSLSETSSNGYFMFIGLEAGSYRVVAGKDNNVLGNQLFIAEDDAAAFQHIETLEVPRTKIARSYDAFTSEPIETDIATSDLSESLTTQGGTANFRCLSTANVAEFIVNTADRAYLPSRYVQNGNREFAHIPMIQEAWLSEIKRMKLINENPAAGTIIGFTMGLDYSAYLALDSYDSANIAYFDQGGKLVASPVNGGGFVLFNVPAGAREVVLQENGTDRIFSQVFDIKSQQLSTAHFSE